MLNPKTLKALEGGAYVTCDCFQEIMEQARRELCAGGKLPKLASPVSEVLGKTVLPFLKFLSEKGRYSTRVCDASRYTVVWRYCPRCGRELRPATGKDRIFWRKND